MQDMEKLKYSRGKHVRMVRSMTGLTIIDFAKELGVSRGSVIGWEQGKAGGLTEKGAEKIVSVAEKYKISCANIWLMHGIGDPPAFMNKTIAEPKQKYSTKNQKPDIPAPVIKEINLFESNYKNAVTTRLEDDCMQPFFAAGDVVGGVELFGSEINKALGEHCIVETVNNEILVRKLTQGSTTNVYNLLSTNLDSQAINSILTDVTLLSAAPIVWIRLL